MIRLLLCWDLSGSKKLQSKGSSRGPLARKWLNQCKYSIQLNIFRSKSLEMFLKNMIFGCISHNGAPTRVLPGRLEQSVTCLATDASLTADPGVASSIPARSHTFVEIDHEIISTVILLPSAESFKTGCCQLQAKVCAQSTD